MKLLPHFISLFLYTLCYTAQQPLSTNPDFTPEELANCIAEGLYQDHIETTANAAVAFLNTIKVVKPEMTVIFDVDATVLNQQYYFQFPPALLAKSVHYYFHAIPRMRELCWYVYKRSFKILFVTARQEKYPEPANHVALATMINLNAEKFPPFELMCRPYNTDLDAVAWKRQIHAELAKQLPIVAIFDDNKEILYDVTLPGTQLFLVPTRENFNVIKR